MSGRALAISDPLRIVALELGRSYILAGRKQAAPPLADITEQAGAILAQNEREPRPIPPGMWEWVFQFARRRWGLPGWSELIGTWESEEFGRWQAARWEQQRKAQPKPPQPPPISAEENARMWEEIWAEEERAGRWVPSCFKKKSP